MNNKQQKIAAVAALTATIALYGPATIKAHAENNETNAYYQEVQETVYCVKKGDTLSSISKYFFGNAMYYEAIAKYNNIKDPNTIYAGQYIKIPSKLEDLLTFTTYSDDKVYIVKSGDTLSEIVEALYGQSDRQTVDLFATYNRIEDINKIVTGQSLLVPDREKLDTIIPYDYSDQWGMKRIRRSGCRHK